MLDNNDQPVLNSDGTRAGATRWRYSDYTRVGRPAVGIDSDRCLRAIITSHFPAPGRCIKGDTYTIQYLQAPVNFDYDTLQNNQSALGPRAWEPGNIPDSHGQPDYGNIQSHPRKSPARS